MPRYFNSETGREAGKKGSRARSENARNRKTMKEDMKILLNMSIKKGSMVLPEDIENLADSLGMNVPVQTAIDIAMVQRAMLGDVQAAQFIRDTIGEKPTDKMEMDQSLTIETWAKTKNVKL